MVEAKLPPPRPLRVKGKIKIKEKITLIQIKVLKLGKQFAYSDNLMRTIHITFILYYLPIKRLRCFL